MSIEDGYLCLLIIYPHSETNQSQKSVHFAEARLLVRKNLSSASGALSSATRITKAGGGRKEKKAQTFYTDVGSILFRYNENDLFSSRGRKADGGQRKEEKWSVSPPRKEVPNALNYSPLRWLISIEAPGQSGSFSMRLSFHLNRDGGAQLKAYQFVSKSTPIKVVTSNKTIIIATRLCH